MYLTALSFPDLFDATFDEQSFSCVLKSLFALVKCGCKTNCLPARQACDVQRYPLSNTFKNGITLPSTKSVSWNDC